MIQSGERHVEYAVLEQTVARAAGTAESGGSERRMQDMRSGGDA
jgi:hypothetical protein